MNYIDCVVKGRLLVKDYSKLRYEIADLAIKVVEQNPDKSISEFARDIGMHEETVRSWVRDNYKVTKVLKDSGVINSRTKKVNNAIHRMRGVGVNDSAEDIVKEYNRVVYRMDNDKDLLNCEKYMLTLKNFVLGYDLSLFNQDEVNELRETLIKARSLV